MRINDDDTRQRLAAEYVLGTLTGRARRRFERLLEEDVWLRRAVEDWQHRLNPLVEVLPPVAPPGRIWRRVRRQMRRDREAGLHFWQRVNFWRGFGFAAACLAVFLLYRQAGFEPVVPQPRYVVVFTDAKSQLAWYLQLTREGREMLVKAVAPPALTPDRDFELWMLPAGGQPPRSLGLLPRSGTRRLVIPAQEAAALGEAAGLAVSIEPRGGSPTGAPTGPVILQAPLVSL